MKYLSEWDQWKRYSSKSWKRFIEKAREMTTHLELWREDIRSIEGTLLANVSCVCVSMEVSCTWRRTLFTSLQLKCSISLHHECEPQTTVRMNRACVFVPRKITDVLLSLPVVVVICAGHTSEIRTGEFPLWRSG